MNLLLDTHSLLWWLADEPTMASAGKEAIANPENTVFLSAVAIWEIRIKHSLGKLEIPAGFADVVGAESFLELPVTVEHAHALAELPHHHRDPFDRMLIAQARIERLSIVTRDPVFAEYGVPLVPA